MTPTALGIGLALFLPSAPALKPAKSDEPPVMRGEVSYWSRVGNYPKVIGSPKALQVLLDRWGIEDVPAVDFQRYVLVVATTLGPELTMDTEVDAAGNLKFARPVSVPAGYRVGTVKVGIKAVGRAGVKSAFGRPLPTD